MAGDNLHIQHRDNWRSSGGRSCCCESTWTTLTINFWSRAVFNGLGWTRSLNATAYHSILGNAVHSVLPATTILEQANKLPTAPWSFTASSTTALVRLGGFNPNSKCVQLYKREPGWCWKIINLFSYYVYRKTKGKNRGKISQEDIQVFPSTALSYFLM